MCSLFPSLHSSFFLSSLHINIIVFSPPFFLTLALSLFLYLSIYLSFTFYRANLNYRSVLFSLFFLSLLQWIPEDNPRSFNFSLVVRRYPTLPCVSVCVCLKRMTLEKKGYAILTWWDYLFFPSLFSFFHSSSSNVVRKRGSIVYRSTTKGGVSGRKKKRKRNNI